jgi:hypothetical protein
MDMNGIQEEYICEQSKNTFIEVSIYLLKYVCNYLNNNNLCTCEELNKV